MNTVLNTNRLFLLLKRYFIENRQRELTFWGITVFVFTLLSLSGAPNNTTILLYMFISGLIFAAKTFKIFDYTSNGMHYLLIPANHIEKLTIAIFITTFYFFVMTIIAYVMGTILGTTMGNLLLNADNPIHIMMLKSASITTVNGVKLLHPSSSLWNTFISFASVQSLFMLGSIYFKGNSVGKTTLAIMGVMMLLFILEMFLLRLTFGSDRIEGENLAINLVFNASLFDGMFTGGQIVRILLIPFFWMVTYYRLTEKEV